MYGVGGYYNLEDKYQTKPNQPTHVPKPTSPQPNQMEGGDITTYCTTTIMIITTPLPLYSNNQLYGHQVLSTVPLHKLEYSWN